jgi:hypothetical protein
LDIVKNVFQAHWIDEAEKVVVRKQLRRSQGVALGAWRLGVKHNAQGRKSWKTPSTTSKAEV